MSNNKTLRPTYELDNSPDMRRKVPIKYHMSASLGYMCHKPTSLGDTQRMPNVYVRHLNFIKKGYDTSEIKSTFIVLLNVSI